MIELFNQVVLIPEESLITEALQTIEPTLYPSLITLEKEKTTQLMKILPHKQSGDRQLIETPYTSDLEKVFQGKDFRFSSGESD